MPTSGKAKPTTCRKSGAARNRWCRSCAHRLKKRCAGLTNRPRREPSPATRESACDKKETVLKIPGLVSYPVKRDADAAKLLLAFKVNSRRPIKVRRVDSTVSRTFNPLSQPLNLVVGNFLEAIALLANQRPLHHISSNIVGGDSFQQNIVKVEREDLRRNTNNTEEENWSHEPWRESTGRGEAFGQRR